MSKAQEIISLIRETKVESNKVAKAIEKELKAQKIKYKVEGADKGIIFEISFKTEEDVRDLIRKATKGLSSRIASLADATRSADTSWSIFVDFQ